VARAATASAGAVFNAGPLYGALPGGTLVQGGDPGSGATDGADGQGLGGGLYLATGSTTTLTKTLVTGNRASTSNNDIYGTYGS
jgi:hypothetical protein